MITLRPSHQDTIIGALQETVQAINYHNNVIAPALDTLDASDAREFLLSFDDYTQDRAKYEAYLMDNEAVFNKLLSSYGLTVAVFIARLK